MCKCTPNMKTPFCGKGDCQWPIQEGVRLDMSCQHYWEFQSTQYQFPASTTGTNLAKEYAYLLCRKCGEVTKREVKV